VPKTRYSSPEIAQMLKRVEEIMARGATLSEAASTIGVKYGTVYQWHRRFAGLDAVGVDALRVLEKENGRLRRLLLEGELTR
jgi:transposase-like protein